MSPADRTWQNRINGYIGRISLGAFLAQYSGKRATNKTARKEKKRNNT